MPLQVDLYSVDGATHLAKLPKATGVEVMEERNGDGVLSFKVAAGSKGAAELLAAVEGVLQVSLDGEPIAWGVLDQDGDDPTDAKGDQRPVAVTAAGTVTLLADALVFGDSATSTSRAFTAATPGRILRTLLLEAQGRGALQGVTWSFTDDQDSNGQPWGGTLSPSYDVGTTLRAVLQQLTDQLVVDARMVGWRLDAYRPDTELARDRSTVELQPRWFTEAPRQRSRQSRVSHLTVVGDGGTIVTATATGGGRRREAFAQIGGIPDAGTLQAAADATLLPLATNREGMTVSYLLPPKSDRPRPWADYRPGDYIRHRGVRLPTGDLEPLRVTSVSASLSDAGVTGVALELNDVFLEGQVRDKLRLDQLATGAVVTRPADYGPDYLKPAPPGSIALTSSVYEFGDGQAAAQATVSWPYVTTNEDGSPAGDIAGYEVQWNLNAQGFLGTIDRTQLQALSRSGFPLGGTIQARVRAVDTRGNYSDWTTSGIYDLARDETPPPKPSAPTAASMLGLVEVSWDGKAFDGSAMPADLRRVNVWRATAPGVAPGAAGSTYVGQILPGGGRVAITDSAYDAAAYVVLQPVDRSGNLGTVSDEVVGYRRKLVTLDVSDAVLADGDLANPSFEDWPDGQTYPTTWSGVNGYAPPERADAGGQLAGLRSVRLVPTTSTPAGLVGKAVPCAGGEQWYYAATVQLEAASPNFNAPLTLSVGFYDAAGALVGTGTILGGTNALTDRNSLNPQRIERRVQAPAGAVTTKLFLLAPAIAEPVALRVDGISVTRVVTSVLIGTAQIKTANIEDLAVNAAKIANASIGTAKVLELSADKITSGSFTTQVGFVGGELIAGLPSAQRVAMGGYGIRSYNSGNVLTGSIDSATGLWYAAGEFWSGPEGSTRVGLLPNINSASGTPAAGIVFETPGTFQGPYIVGGSSDGLPRILQLISGSSSTAVLHSELEIEPANIDLLVGVPWNGQGAQSHLTLTSSTLTTNVPFNGVNERGGVVSSGTFDFEGQTRWLDLTWETPFPTMAGTIIVCEVTPATADPGNVTCGVGSVTRQGLRVYWCRKSGTGAINAHVVARMVFV